jgi:hypothetical protein
MERSNLSIIAVAWFRPEEWSDLKRLCPDLHETYQEWLTEAEATIEVLDSPLKAQKAQVVKIVMTVDELRRWKRATGRDVDSTARSALAAKIAAKNHRANH